MIVARRPVESCRICSKSAAVGVAVASPTPIPDKTAREESRLAIVEAKAWRES